MYSHNVFCIYRVYQVWPNLNLHLVVYQYDLLLYLFFSDLVAIVVPTVVASFVIIAIMLAIIVVLKRR